MNCWKVLQNSSELENLNQILLSILNTPDTRPEITLFRILSKKLNGSYETTNETTPFEDFNDICKLVLNFRNFRCLLFDSGYIVNSTKRYGKFCKI